MDGYLVYASSALVAMGLVASALAFVFRLRRKRLDAVAAGSVATVFDRTFTVFDPYEKKTVFHRFVSFLLFIPLVGGVGIATLFLVVIDSGLLLTLLVVILALGLIVVEESSETLAESRALIRAIQNGKGLGAGDIRVLELMRKMLPRLTSYYLGLAVGLFALAGALPYVWSGVLLGVAAFLGYLIQASVAAGPVSWMLSIVLYGGGIVAFVYLLTIAKNRFFGHHMETAPA